MRAVQLLATLSVLLTSCSTTGRSPLETSNKSRRGVIADPNFFKQYAATRRFSLGKPRSIKVTPDGDAVLFLRSGPRSFSQNLFEFDTKTGQESRLLTADEILQGAEEELTAEELARRERMRVSARGIVSYRLDQEGTKILAPLSGRLFIIQRSDRSVKELQSDNGYPIDARFSPDGRSVSCVRDGELYVMNVETGDERKLTTGSSDTITNGLSEFVAQEEMGRFRGYWWSPDSGTIVYQQTDTQGLETMHIMDATDPSTAPSTWPYPRPGKANAKVRLGITPTAGGDTTWISWDVQRYPYLATVRWEENAPLTILVQNREQTEQALLTVDPTTGQTAELLVEKDSAWINLDQRMPKWLPDGSSFFWTTERRGAWQLELRHREGRLISVLTSTDFGFKRFVSYDEQQRAIYLTGSDDPTQTHLYRLEIGSGENRPKRITSEPGLHGATFAKNHAAYVHTFSHLDGTHGVIVRDRDGRALGELKSVAEEAPFIPHIEMTTVEHERLYHAVIVRPRNFKKNRRYPVIVSVYGGPHGQTVRANPNGYILQQWIADHGFIVVSIDGRGTPSRGRKWERVIKGNLIDVPLHDQVDALHALGKKYREMDLSRVGIFGWSFGGYFSAMAVMRRPDVYHVGVAGAPVADWYDYDTHYTERYMGLPENNLDGYKASSVLTYAKDLQRPLMIIHGTADDNVYFMHSLKMSNALFREGKPHEFLALSGFTHMVADPIVTLRLYTRIINYFEQHLLQ